ncbi:MAG: UDP-N-acetylmuramoyl-L-alanyl-D-glutamate--2,6-diaminopimelate ligase [Rubrivivax sp.]
MLPVLRHPDEAAAWLAGRGAAALRSDSRAVRPGDAFFAWPGHTNDARAHVPRALAAGAVACLVEAAGHEAFGFDDPRIAAYSGLKTAAGEVASAVLGHPSRQLRVLAVTGTNGKTSTAWWCAQALRSAGRGCAVVGTLGLGEPPAADAPVQALPSAGLTTPDPLALQQALAGFVHQGLAACALEASSIGLEEGRLAGTRIEVAIFTNLTRDHLDYHGTMEAYWAAKRRLFDWPGLRAAVVNVDDPMGARLAAELQASRAACWTVSARGDARLVARQARIVQGGLAFELQEAGARASVRTSLIGDFNVHNVLGVVGALRACGLSLEEAARAVQHLGPVPGRLERVGRPGPAGALGPEVIVDYAHTPDALEKVLQTLRPLAAARGGELWCVFGCGGDRDATKRAPMGAIAARLARHVVVTSDNPRTEDPAAIVAQVLAGMPGLPELLASGMRVCEAVLDRREAIERAVLGAAQADVVLVAGKGHETWQETGRERLPFSDVEHARLALTRRAATPAAVGETTGAGHAGEPKRRGVAA